MYLGLPPDFTAPKPIISPAMMGFGAVKSCLQPAIGARLYPSYGPESEFMVKSNRVDTVLDVNPLIEKFMADKPPDA